MIGVCLFVVYLQKLAIETVVLNIQFISRRFDIYTLIIYRKISNICGTLCVYKIYKFIDTKL